MGSGLHDLYRLTKRDSKSAAKVLADAFDDDPLWDRVMRGSSRSKRIFLFEAPTRYCLHYGEVCAPSSALEGIIAWVSGRAADMTLWRIFRSGALWPGLRMGVRMGRRMQIVFRQILIDRRRYIDNRLSIYLQILGVSKSFQGKGFGGMMLKFLIRKSNEMGAPIYLETEIEDNVSLYEHFGFTVIKKLILPMIDVPMWEMAREPER